jgi:hypothetical protein
MSNSSPGGAGNVTASWMVRGFNVCMSQDGAARMERSIRLSGHSVGVACGAESPKENE